MSAKTPSWPDGLGTDTLLQAVPFHRPTIGQRVYVPMSPTVHAFVSDVATTALRTPYVVHGAAVLTHVPFTQCPIKGTRLPSAVALARPTTHAG